MNKNILHLQFEILLVLNNFVILTNTHFNIFFQLMHFFHTTNQASNEKMFKSNNKLLIFSPNNYLIIAKKYLNLIH